MQESLFSDPPPAAQRGAPLEVSAAWLEQLARGETPEELAGLLEDQVRAAQADPPLEEPTTPTDRPREIPPSEKSASGDR